MSNIPRVSAYFTPNSFRPKVVYLSPKRMSWHPPPHFPEIRVYDGCLNENVTRKCQTYLEYHHLSLSTHSDQVVMDLSPKRRSHPYFSKIWVYKGKCNRKIWGNVNLPWGNVTGKCKTYLEYHHISLSTHPDQ